MKTLKNSVLLLSVLVVLFLYQGCAHYTDQGAFHAGSPWLGISQTDAIQLDQHQLRMQQTQAGMFYTQLLAQGSVAPQVSSATLVSNATSTVTSGMAYAQATLQASESKVLDLIQQGLIQIKGPQQVDFKVIIRNYSHRRSYSFTIYDYAGNVRFRELLGAEQQSITYLPPGVYTGISSVNGKKRGEGQSEINALNEKKMQGEPCYMYFAIDLNQW